MLDTNLNREQAVHVTNLRLKFPGESSFVMKDLSFAVPKGQKVLLLGPSGCGKSTLLQVLSGIIPHSLEVPMKHDQIGLPRSWGFIFQDPDTQFGLPYVDEELAFVLENSQVPREQMDAQIREVLRRVGLSLDDLHTPIQSLSQGMKQRLALASVLLLDPEVLFLDEPSALLDPEGTVQIWDTVKQISSDRTLLIVEHKIEQIADWVDRVVLFNSNGEIIADGSAASVFHDHHAELQAYGIWHPTVWQEYARNSKYREIRQGRQLESKFNNHEASTALLQLNNFQGYHHQIAKITVPHATVGAYDWITIVGENGAGKSTLLLSLMQLVATTGTYCLEDEVIEPRKKRRWLPGMQASKHTEVMLKLGFVFQNPELQFITNSIYEELAHTVRQTEEVSSKQVEVEVQRMLAKFDLHMNQDRHPYQLSIGQKRRLSVATAIVNKQLIVLLDEPTFGQDAKNTMAILEMLEQLRAQGIAIVMVTHDLHIVEHFATQVWTVDQGVLAQIEHRQALRSVADEVDFVESSVATSGITSSAKRQLDLIDEPHAAKHEIAATTEQQQPIAISKGFTLAPDRETWAHRINPALKFTVFVVVLLIILFNQNIETARNLLIGFFLLLVLGSGYGWRRLLLFLSPFVLMFISSASTMILFGKGEQVWWQWGLIKISEESFRSGMLIGIKTLTFGLAGMFFTLTSKPILLFYSLMQQYRLPAKYGYSFIASMRLLPAVWDEIWIRSNALRVRGVRYARGIKGVYKRLSLYAVPLLAQSIRRAQRVAIAMEAKRFQMGAVRTYYYVTTYTKMDIVFIVLAVIFIGLAFYI
ncbi:ATP-binding cassette domain-containing protein [Paenibacillus sp. N1-5-1-14]|uniref:ATP-binding cassette domain-containing protein n=1 Tax=Paenibacillus radicibacter TaxID=2972488 RepID=UPI002158C4A6|nr:ATP-binding cassette domain-containing protein [Paenibacillus radicibacter]MCR8644659.1 ATP-binding cassette domain-containing protein [Paenibacillus radicibacter]